MIWLNDYQAFVLCEHFGIRCIPLMHISIVLLTVVVEYFKDRYVTSTASI